MLISTFFSPAALTFVGAIILLNLVYFFVAKRIKEQKNDPPLSDKELRKMLHTHGPDKVINIKKENNKWVVTPENVELKKNK